MLLCVFIDYTLPRYFDFLAADAPPSSLSFVDQMLRCAEAQPFPAGREILQEGNADDRASERSAAALYDVRRCACPCPGCNCFTHVVGFTLLAHE